MDETKLGEFITKIAGKTATDLFTLSESEFATAPESKEVPNKTLVLPRDSESTDVKKSRSELESETITNLKKWIDSKTGQSSIDVTGGLSLSQSMVLGLKSDLEHVTESNKLLIREQSLNALYMLIAGNAVVEKIQSDIRLLIDTADKIIQFFKLDKQIKKQEAAAQNIEAQKESYRKLESTRIKKMTETLTLFADQQKAINTEMLLLKEILRAPTASSGWWPSHGLTGKIKEAWYGKDMRSMQAVEHVHPLFTKTNVQTTLDSFKLSLTLMDKGLEEIIFGKPIEDSKLSIEQNTNSDSQPSLDSSSISIVDSSTSQKDGTLDESDDSLHASLASSQDTPHKDSNEGEGNADGKKKD